MTNAYAPVSPASGADAPLIRVRHVTRRYDTNAGAFLALDDVSLTIADGEFAVIIGASGSGKSTLLGMLAGIDQPSTGEVHVGDTAVHLLREREKSAWRGSAVGIVFQFFQLMPTLTVLENVMLPMDFAGVVRAAERRARAEALLDRLGVGSQANKLPSTLSGGQQQRVAVARAMANTPTVLLCDEPTGNLDSKTAESMLELLASLAAGGQTVVMVTHDVRAQRMATHTIMLADGRVVHDEVHAPAMSSELSSTMSSATQLATQVAEIGVSGTVTHDLASCDVESR